MNDVGNSLGDGSIDFDKGFVNLHPFQGSQWAIFKYEVFFDSYGCSPPQKLSKFIKRNGHCFSSENKIQGLTSKRESFCASFCLYIICLTKVIGLDFKSAVLYLYYQMI